MIDLERRRPTRLPDFIHALLIPNHERALDDDFPKLTLPETFAHSCDFRVRYSDLDLNGHVNNIRYVEWAAETFPRDMRERSRLTGLEVHYRGETSCPDTVTAYAGTTDAGTADAGPSGQTPAGTTYAHRLTRGSDGREVARLRTRWVDG